MDMQVTKSASVDRAALSHSAAAQAPRRKARRSPRLAAFQTRDYEWRRCKCTMLRDAAAIGSRTLDPWIAVACV